MLKRGQVTIFIIIAILMVGVVMIYFTFSKENNQSNKIIDDFQPVYQKVQECLELTSEEAVIYVGQHGGYYNAPESITLDYFGKKIPYYYLNSTKKIPEKESIELELNNYMNNKFENCINFEDFISKGVNIRSGKPEAITSITTDSAQFKMDYSLVVSNENKTQIFEDFSAIVPFNIIELLDYSKEIVDDYSKKPGVICVSCLNDISIKNNIGINSNFLNNNTIFTIYSKSDGKDNETKLKWTFVVGK